MTPPKVLIFSDLHIRAPGQDIVGLDPAARFRAALDHALARHGDAQAIVLLGDLTHFGSRREYRVLRDLLDDLPLPVIATLGNHDRRTGYYQVFPDAPRDPQGFAQSVLDLGTHRIVILDTLDENGIAPHHGGHLCAARLEWLRAQLDDARPTAVLCHHPPFATGFTGMDTIGLVNGAALLAVLADAPQVGQLISGHIHRSLSGTVGRLTVAVLASPCHQMPMMLDDPSTAMSETSAGGYGILLAMPDGWILHGDTVANAAIADDPSSERT